jgi:hypothetical protein
MHAVADAAVGRRGRAHVGLLELLPKADEFSIDENLREIAFACKR